MLKRKKVYICDHCGAVALPVTYVFFSDIWTGPPEGWCSLGKKEDLCPICAEAYRRFLHERRLVHAMKDKVKIVTKKEDK